MPKPWKKSNLIRATKERKNVAYWLFRKWLDCVRRGVSDVKLSMPKALIKICGIISSSSGV